MKKQKMAEGGEVGDGTIKNHPRLEALRRILTQPSAAGPELKGFHDMMAKASGQGEEPATSKTDPEQEPVRMADGGGVWDQIKSMYPKVQAAADFASNPVMGAFDIASSLGSQSVANQQPSDDGSVDLSQLPTPPPTPPTPKVASQPAAPAMGDVLKQAQSAPPTNYDFYGDVNSDKVAALYKQLLAQKSSPGNLLASGAAGLGDSIANSFGHGGAHAMQNVQDIQNKNVSDRIGGAEMERQNKAQDMQANTEQGLNDPNSPISHSMRSLFQKQGIKVPSGMPATLMMKLAPDLGNLALKQATLQSENMFRGATLGLRQGELKERNDAEKEKEREHKVEHPILSAIADMRGGDNGSVANPYQAELDRRRKSNG